MKILPIFLCLFCIWSFCQNIILQPLPKVVSGVIELQATGEKHECQFFLSEKFLGIGTWEGNTCKYLWNTSIHDDGDYTLLTQNGDVITNEVHIVIDNTSPVMDEFSYIQKSRDEVHIQIKTHDVKSKIASVQFSIDQKWKISATLEKTDTSAIAKGIWIAPPSALGYHAIEIEIVDDLGNITKVTNEKIRMDKQGPLVQVLAPLTQGPTNGPLTCEVKITDPAGIKDVQFELKQNPNAIGTTWQDKDVWGIKWHDLPDEKYQITIITTDLLGNINTVHVFTERDQTPATIIWKQPTENTVFSQLIPLSVEIQDTSSIIQVRLSGNSSESVHWKQNGNTWLSELIPTQDGPISLVVEAKDSAGNIAQSNPLCVTYDNTPPIATLFYPKRDFYSNDLDVEIQAEDKLSGISKVEFFLKDQPLTLQSTRQNVWESKIIVPQSGDYCLTANVWDGAGNITKLPEVCLSMDIDAPEIEIDKNCPTIFQDQVHLPIRVKDHVSGVKEITVGLYDKIIFISEDTTNNPYLIWDVSNWEEGWYPLVIQATDKAGNKMEGKSIQVAIDRSFPKIVAEILPTKLQIGMIRAKVTWEDKPSGIDTNIVPNFFLDLAEQSFPMQLDSFHESQAEATLLITSSHPEGTANIRLQGLSDKAGHVLPDTILGKITIQSLGGSWPLLPSDQAHSLLAAWDKDRPLEKSGIWIAASHNAEVKAIEDGQIVEICLSSQNQPGYMRIQRLRDSVVWGYHHILVGANPIANRAWMPGDVVRAGETIARVPTITENEFSYVYLELLTWKDNVWQVVTSPIAFLQPKPSPIRISASVLSLSPTESHERHLQYFIPRRYQEFPKKNYASIDIILVLYILVLVGGWYGMRCLQQYRTINSMSKAKLEETKQG